MEWQTLGLIVAALLGAFMLFASSAQIRNCLDAMADPIFGSSVFKVRQGESSFSFVMRQTGYQEAKTRILAHHFLLGIITGGAVILLTILFGGEDWASKLFLGITLSGSSLRGRRIMHEKLIEIFCWKAILLSDDAHDIKKLADDIHVRIQEGLLDPDEGYLTRRILEQIYQEKLALQRKKEEGE